MGNLRLVASPRGKPNRNNVCLVILIEIYESVVSV